MVFLGRPRASTPSVGRPSAFSAKRQITLVIALGSAVSLSLGWLVAEGYAAVAIAIAAALAAAFAVARAGIVVITGLVILLTLDGFPGINASRLHVAGAFNPYDAGVVVLVVIGGARYFFGRSSPLGRSARWLVVWAALFLLYWLFAWYRAVDRGVPLLQAATFGQDFLLFGLLVPVAPWLVKNRAEAVRLLTVLAVVTAAYTLVDVTASLRVISPSLANAFHTVPFGPITRIYVNMTDLIILALACSIGFALVMRGRFRTLAIALAVITGTATALALTRAYYIGLLVGLVAGVGAAFAWGPAWLGRRLRSHALGLVGGVVFAAVVVGLFVPQLFHTGSAEYVVSRFTSGFSDLATGSQTVVPNNLTYRQGVDKVMLGLLGGHWPIGLGFLHPAAFYFPSLPSGTIRNVDTGVFNSLMTMGAIGTLLLYAPLAYVTVAVLRGWRTDHDEAYAAMRLGVVIWVAATVVASVTVVTLFSITGLAMTAVVIGVVLRLMTDHWSTEREADPSRT
jgi:hypothetical protein